MEFSILDGKTEFTILDGKLENFQKIAKKSSNSIEVRQKGRHCAERECYLPLTCDTGTVERFLFVSSIYLCTTKTWWKH